MVAASSEQVQAEIAGLTQAGMFTEEEIGTTRCFATQDRVWVTGLAGKTGGLHRAGRFRHVRPQPAHLDDPNAEGGLCWLPDALVVEPGKSFPSGHTQAAIVGYGVLLLVSLPVIGRRYRPWLFAFAMTMVVLIGFSRSRSALTISPMSSAPR